jgi:hypothetical protein
LGYHFGKYADVLVVLHWRAEIVVSDIYAELAGPFVGVTGGAVDMQLCIQHCNGGGACVAGAIELVTPSGHADAVSFRFF